MIQTKEGTKNNLPRRRTLLSEWKQGRIGNEEEEPRKKKQQ